MSDYVLPGGRVATIFDKYGQDRYGQRCTAGSGQPASSWPIHTTSRASLSLGRKACGISSTVIVWNASGWAAAPADGLSPET